MQLTAADLDETEEPRDIINPQPHAFAALALTDAKLMHGFGHVRERAHMIERDAVGMTDELERSVAEMRERPLRHLPPIRDEVFLRRHDRVRQQLQDVLARNPMRATTSRTRLRHRRRAS